MEAPRTPPIGLNAALDIAISLPRAASEDEGERALGLKMAELTLARCTEMCSGDAAHEAYLGELLPRLWAVSHVLIRGRQAALRELDEANAVYEKTRASLDRLAGVGSIGVNGWLARLGALLAGFSVPQLIDELNEQQERVAVAVDRSGALARHIEAVILAELKEPLFGELLLVSLLFGVASLFLAGLVLRKYRLRRIERLQAEMDLAEQEASARIKARHREALTALLATLTQVMERHYPGAAAAEIGITTGQAVMTEELLSGRASGALDALLAQHIGA